MKIIILFYYFFRSLILRGPYAHFHMLFGELHYERKYGIRSTGFKTSDSNKHHHYQAAAYTVLIRILKFLVPITKNYAFYDIGCGKGRVMFMAAQFGYKTLYGIELDEALLLEAKANLQPLFSQKETFNIQLIRKNVLEYNFENQVSVYFLFNPFNPEVLKEFLEKVINANQKECVFVYMNPLYANVFKQKNIPIHRVIKSFLYTEAIVYHLPARAC